MSILNSFMNEILIPNDICMIFLNKLDWFDLNGMCRVDKSWKEKVNIIKRIKLKNIKNVKWTIDFDKLNNIGIILMAFNYNNQVLNVKFYCDKWIYHNKRYLHQIISDGQIFNKVKNSFVFNTSYEKSICCNSYGMTSSIIFNHKVRRKCNLLVVGTLFLYIQSINNGCQLFKKSTIDDESKQFVIELDNILNDII